MISWWNKRFSANNLILLTSAFGLGHKILLPQFTTFTGNNDLFLSALRASRNKRIIFCFKSFISSLDHYDLRIIIILFFSKTIASHTVLYQFQIPLEEDVSEEIPFAITDKTRRERILEILRWSFEPSAIQHSQSFLVGFPNLDWIGRVGYT